MDIVTDTRHFETLKIQFRGEICFMQIHRPQANNTINAQLIEELAQVLDLCEKEIKIVVLEGLPEVFCFGADFQEIARGFQNQDALQMMNPEPMYNLWLRLASGPYITIAHVRGQVNAGGIGFVAACDLAFCDEKATFGLSELLFGLMPACVLPFLARRMGFSRANHMTLMTEPVSAACACEWGLVDEVAADSQNLLRKKLLRLTRLSKTTIDRYKRYLNTLNESLTSSRCKALQANIEVFSDQENLRKITRYVKTGQFPWERGSS